MLHDLFGYLAMAAISFGFFALALKRQVDAAVTLAPSGEEIDDEVCDDECSGCYWRRMRHAALAAALWPIMWLVVLGSVIAGSGEDDDS